MAGLSDLAQPGTAEAAVPPPLWLLAELTYRCTLHSVFCYNPTQHARLQAEMSTAQWVDVMRQARALGAAAQGRRPGPCPAVLPGLDPGTQRFPEPYQDF